MIKEDHLYTIFNHGYISATFSGKEAPHGKINGNLIDLGKIVKEI